MALQGARQEVWAELQGYRVTRLLLPGLQHTYLPPGGSLQQSQDLLQLWQRLPALQDPATALCRSGPATAISTCWAGCCTAGPARTSTTQWWCGLMLSAHGSIKLQ